MVLVRLRVAHRGQVELHETTATEVEIGRDVGCGLRIDHPSVADRHARLLMRRGRLLLVDLGAAPTRTERGDGRIRAPIMLHPGEGFELGDVHVSARTIDTEARSWTGRVVLGGRVGVELEGANRSVRRYVLERGDAESLELAVAARDSESRAIERSPEYARAIESWLGRAEPGAPGRAMGGWVEGRACRVERLRVGVRLAVFDQAIRERRIRVPLETLLVLFALLAEHLESRAGRAHGAVDPRVIQLGRDGSVRLIDPGPSIEDADVADALIAPERRLDRRATLPGDVFALGALAKGMLERASEVPARVRAVSSWLAHFDPSCRPVELARVADELRDIAQTLGRDATALQVGRAVNLLLPSRPILASVAPGLGGPPVS